MLYPFTILATWFHEMGHGVTALLLGGSFNSLVLWPNASGMADTSAPMWLGRFGAGLIAAGGPLGPVVVGAGFIRSGRTPRSSTWGLYALGLLLILSAVVWVRTLFGLAAITAWGGATLGLALKGPDWLKQFSVQFFGVQACISVYRSIDYLFMRQAEIGGRVMTSDTGAIQSALLLPYWFWAWVIVALSIALLIKTLSDVLR